MLLEEFVVLLGAETETGKVKDFAGALAKVGTIATVVVGAVKAVALTAWAFADGYVRRAEELYNSNNSLVKITKEQVEMSKKYQDGMGTLGKIIESVKIKVAFGFLPTMLNMVNTFNDFLNANKDLIANGISKLLTVVGYLSQVINNTVRFIVKIIEATVGWKGALLILVGVFALVKRAMLLAFITNPIAWVILAIGALLLLIDDFMTYLDGGESQFGEFWGSMIKWINKAKDIWNNFSEDAKSSIKAISVALGMLASAPVIIRAMTSLFSILGSVVSFLVSPITTLIKTVMMLGKAFLIAGRFMIANPIVLVAAIIAGIIYVIYDLIKWIKTGESQFGSFWKYLADVWEKIKAKVLSVKDSIVQSFKDMISSLTDAVSNVFDIVTAPFAKAFNWISDKFSGIGNLISGAVSGAKGLVSLGGASSASNKTVNGGNLTINAPVTVTGNNAVATGNSVSQALYSGAGTAYRNMNTSYT